MFERIREPVMLVIREIGGMLSLRKLKTVNTSVSWCRTPSDAISSVLSELAYIPMNSSAPIDVSHVCTWTRR